MPILAPQFIALSAVAAMPHGIPPLLPPPLLGLIDVSEHVIGLGALVGSLGFVAVMGVAVFYFQSKKRQMWHETARLALEKGQSIALAAAATVASLAVAYWPALGRLRRLAEEKGRPDSGRPVEREYSLRLCRDRTGNKESCPETEAG